MPIEMIVILATACLVGTTWLLCRVADRLRGRP